MIVILDNIRSLHNVGSVFRTADAAGAAKLYLTGITAAPIDRYGRARPQISKVSLGAETYLPWEKITIPSAKFIGELKKQGYKIWALEQGRTAIPYLKMKARKSDFSKIALVLGNEVKGVSRKLLALSDKILEIPMHGKKESLNVAVAFGIVVFHLRNFRP